MFLWEKIGPCYRSWILVLIMNAVPGFNLGKPFLRGLDPKGRRPPIDHSAVI